MKSKRVILVHGFNVSDGGKGSIDKLIPGLEARGYEVVQFDYGYLDLFLVRLRTDFISKALYDIVKPNDSIICHSHGCALAAKAMEKGAKFNKVVFIHPALENDWKIPNEFSLNKLTVLYSQKDLATFAAGLLHKFSPLNWLFGKHFWGNMGTIGPTTYDTRICSINDNRHHSQIFDDLDSPVGKAIFDAIE